MADYTETDAEKAAEAVIEDINRYDLSGSKVPRAQSREFWRGIISSLETQLNALDQDDDDDDDEPSWEDDDPDDSDDFDVDVGGSD